MLDEDAFASCMATVAGSIQIEHPSATFQKAVLSRPLMRTEDLDIQADPKINLIYLVPGGKIIGPDVVESCTDRVGTEGSSLLVKISPTMVVKRGDSVNPIEAKTMLFLAEHTTIPVPKIHSVYLYGPVKRTLDDEVPYDVYIFMEFIEGETLQKQWDRYDIETKNQITTELKAYMDQLHSIPGEGYIGSVDRGPITDILLEWTWPTRGPFESEENFNATLSQAYERHSRLPTGPFIQGLLNCHKHDIVFCHGDFRPANIIVKDGHVAAIVDWQQAGWYPEYWDFAKAFYVHTFLTDWSTRLLEILKPFYCVDKLISGATFIRKDVSLEIELIDHL